MVHAASPSPLLPSPPLSIAIDLPAEWSDPTLNSDAVEADLLPLPAKPGVFLLEDARGATLALAITSNLRRMVRTKLEPIDPAAGPTRRVEYRKLARRVLAAPVGSAFEADWAYLQLARQRLPASYRSVMDRWQAWFVQCNPEAEFPQWSKTAHPNPHAAPSNVFIGPMPDKHAAGRYIELLQDAFDLCRHHHLLVQTPRATACAYKEMGRCPAPCDGTVPLRAYIEQIQRSIEFAAMPFDQWRQEQEQAMHQASAALEFETAQRCRQRIDRAAAAGKSEFAQMARLEEFAFLALLPSERKGWVRVFAIRGGWVEPLVDLPLEMPKSPLQELIAAILEQAMRRPVEVSPAGIENIGMVCWHLFRPRNAKGAGEFLRLRRSTGETLALDHKALAAALRRLAKSGVSQEQDESADDGTILNQEMENAPAT